MVAFFESLRLQIKKYYQDLRSTGKKKAASPTGLDYVKGDIFLSHDLGYDHWCLVGSVMQQSIRLTVLSEQDRVNGFDGEDWYFAAPGLLKNHIGLKRLCDLCNKRKDTQDAMEFYLEQSLKNQLLDMGEGTYARWSGEAKKSL